MAERPGQAFEWGINIVGRSGVMPSLQQVQQLSANSDWSLALLQSGKMIAWGSNASGQTNVPSGTDFVYAVAGWRHGIAVKSDGTVDEWGTPYGNDINKWEAARPVISNAVMVAAGDDHSAALLANGTVRIWGGRHLVVTHDNKFSNIVQIASTWYALLMLHANGTVTAVGENSQVGGYITPPPGLDNVVKIACGQFSMYAIKSDGAMVGWGMPNNYGQFTPPANATNLVSIAGGRYHTIAARADGRVFAWGDNSQRQLNIPLSLSNAQFVSAGRYHSQAIQLDAENEPERPVAPRNLRALTP
jgi:alpha-tubulin suppressor-like RCC1 family protein